MWLEVGVGEGADGVVGLASFKKGRVVNDFKSAGFQVVHGWCGFQGLG